MHNGYNNTGNSSQEMKTALILATGSRGDTEPFFALSREMVETGLFDSVHICLQAIYVPFVPYDDRIHAHTLPYDFNSLRISMMEGLQAAAARDVTDAMQLVVHALATVMRKDCVPALEHMLDVARDCNASIVLGTTLTIPCMYTIGEMLNIPTSIVHFQPNVPSKFFPHMLSSMENCHLSATIMSEGCYSRRAATAHEDDYMNSAWFVYNICFDEYSESLNVIREKLGLKPLQSVDLRDTLMGDADHSMVINAFPEHLCPLPGDVGKKVRQVQAFADTYIPKNWSAEKECPELVHYLSEGAPPICVTFGSMDVRRRHGNIMANIFEALRDMNVDRVLVLSSATPIEETEMDVEMIRWIEKHVFVAAESVQYAWLLPLCRALICHGGAGTILASLRAGIAPVIIPVAADQFFWSELIDRAELGARIVASEDVSRKIREELERVFETRVSKKISEYNGMHGDCGCRKAAELLSKLIEECPHLR